MDLITMSERHPKIGETILGNTFFQIPGGKGGNQAIAISKLGGNVTMLGCVGKDSYGDILINELKKNNINVSHIKKTKTNTGIASIVVDKNSNNTIIVVPGANFEITKEDIDKNIHLIKEADIILLQLEIPIKIVKYILKKAKEYNKITILNPAPAEKLTADIIKNVDFLIPNESELEFLTEMPTTSKKEIIGACKKLIKAGSKNIIVTLGKNGSVFVDKNEIFSIGIHNVKAVDSTAAGDSFIGGFVRMLSEEKEIKEAMIFGARVGAITVTKKGAQSSLPTWDEVVNYQFKK